VIDDDGAPARCAAQPHQSEKGTRLKPSPIFRYRSPRRTSLTRPWFVPIIAAMSD
jgi:hypothetical protein